MKEKKRAGSTDLTVRSSLTDPGKRKGFRHPNRICSKRKPLIEMNQAYTFYFDKKGVCCYRLKKRYRHE